MTDEKEFYIVIQEESKNTFIKHYKLPSSSTMACGMKALTTMEIESSMTNKGKDVYSDIVDDFNTEIDHGAGDITVCDKCYHELAINLISKIEVVHECTLTKKELEDEKDKYRASLKENSGLSDEDIEHLVDSPF